jgi:hypothetical protein
VWRFSGVFIVIKLSVENIGADLKGQIGNENDSWFCNSWWIQRLIWRICGHIGTWCKDDTETGWTNSTTDDSCPN